MKFLIMTKVLLLVSILVIFACVQKTELPMQPLKSAVTVNSWHWNDQQQHWINQGSIFDINAKNLSKIPWSYQKKAISLEIESVKPLEVFDDTSNALLMKVFQFSDSRAFLSATTSSSGLKHLLTAEQIDPACISVERFMILPGNTQKLVLDRVEGARYIGVVLGYSNFKQSKISRLIPIVAFTETIATKVMSSSPFSKIDSLAKMKPSVTVDHRPALLKLKLSLGTQGITRFTIDAD